MVLKKTVKFLLLNQEAKMPTIAYNGESVAFDFYSSGEVRILPGETKVVNFDIKVIIPKGYFLMLYNKSSIEYKDRLKVLGGIIDRGYTGKLDCRLTNNGFQEISIEKHKKICQGFLLPSYSYNIKECSIEEFKKYEESSNRKDNGFGSTN